MLNDKSLTTWREEVILPSTRFIDDFSSQISEQTIFLLTSIDRAPQIVKGKSRMIISGPRIDFHVSSVLDILMSDKTTFILVDFLTREILVLLQFSHDKLDRFLVDGGKQDDIISIT